MESYYKVRAASYEQATKFEFIINLKICKADRAAVTTGCRMYMLLTVTVHNAIGILSKGS